MKIGIIGTGNVGAALTKALTKKGFRVMIGSREIAKANALANEMEHFAVGGSIANAIHFGEIVILAVPYKAVESCLRHSDNYRGKIIVDATNPLIFDENGVELAMGFDTSAAEQIAHMLPEVRVVKAFNTATAKMMGEGPYFGPVDGSMCYCGDDEEAKGHVARLIEATGFVPVDCGPLSSARYLEPMAALLVKLALEKKMGPEIAWRLLRRD
jgi:8-hydroxy-5-deazaflavin:NADPH oxidoreductase